ncbi:MAG TPA: hypothetical protein VFU14_13315 [Acidimicrobiales bacterium]|nr:hypothetical protein [Acidimicrobiales bacterium]
MPAPLGTPLAADASLHLLADHLADALADDQLQPCILHVGGIDGDGFDLGVKPLDGAHPTEHLLGLTAPDDWHAVGIATHGHAYHVADRGDPDRRRHRVHVVTLLSRTGEHAHRIRADDPVLATALTGEVPVGEQVDLLRRALQLPTDPPPCDTSVYWSAQWLARLVRDPLPAATVARAIETHPAMELLRRVDHRIDDDAVDVLRAFHRAISWSRMRALVAADRLPVPELLPEDGEWLDDGAFARFVLNRCPPLPLLRARLALHLPADVAEAVLDVLDELGVPAATWPDEAGGTAA